MDIFLAYEQPLAYVLAVIAVISGVALLIRAKDTKDLTALASALTRFLFAGVFTFHTITGTIDALFLQRFCIALIFVADIVKYIVYRGSARYKADIENLRLEKTLHDLMYKYKMMIDASPLGFYTFNEHLFIEYVNDSACKLLGYNMMEMIGTSIVDYIAGPDREMIHDKVDKRFHGANVRDSYPLKLICKNGELIDVTIVSYKTSNGHPTSTGMILTKEQCPEEV